MKRWLAIGAVVIVAGGGAFFLRSRQQSVSAEDNEVPSNVPIETASRAPVTPAGKSGASADLTKLYTWIYSEGWYNQAGNTIHFDGTFYVFNEGKVPVQNLVAEVTLAFRDEESKTKKFIIPLQTMRDFWQRSEKGVLFPNHQSMPIRFDYELSLDYWRRDRMISVRIVEGEKFEDRSNLEEPMQLCAFIQEAPVAKIKEAFTKNPKLKDVVDSLLRLGPMQYALMQPDVEKVKLMESLGFDFNTEVGYGECAYHSAIYGGPKIIEYLASKHAKVRETTDKKLTPAHFATRQWDPTIFSALKKAGPTLDGQDISGETPLMYAVSMRDMDLTKALLEAGANPKLVTKSGTGLLHTAVQLRTTDFMEKLCKLLGRTTEVDKDGNTLLHFAVMYDDLDMASWLIRHGNSPKAKNKIGKTPVDMLSAVTNEGDHQMMSQILSNP